MVEVDTAVGHCHHRIFLGIGDVGLLVNHLNHTLGTGRTHGEVHEDHRQHHQRGEDGHDVGEQGGELTRGEVANDNELGTEPRQGDDAAIDHQHHDGVVEGLQTLGLDKQLIQGFRCLTELLLLEVLPDKSLHHADGGDILLHGAVQVVVALEHLREELHRA